MTGRKDIEKIVEEYFEGTDRFLLDVSVGSNGIIGVIIDGDSDIGINDCVQLSRHIESLLNREENDFELRVSSAGLDRPFEHIRQYKKYLLRPVEIQTKDSEIISGVLQSVDKNGVELKRDSNKKKYSTVKEFVRLGFDEIAMAKPAVKL